MLTERFAKALALAIEAHDGQKRKGTDIPYISHPMAVAAIALEYGADEEQAMAALLHDAVEDGGAPFAHRIRTQFGDRVADIVEGCTDGVPDASGQKEEWKPRKTRYLDHLQHASADVLLVSGSDKLHNARAIVTDLERSGYKVLEKFNGTPEEIVKYYSECLRIGTAKNVPDTLIIPLGLAVETIREYVEAGGK